MSNHNLLLDVAKARQADLAREVAMNRVVTIQRRSQKVGIPGKETASLPSIAGLESLASP